MRKYIENLTNNLIGKNRYDELFLHVNPDEFIQHVKLDLECSDLQDMVPETLGKIMCAFEIGDVMASKEDLFKAVHFCGYGKELLREFVALFLAYAIRGRLDPNWPATVPPYRKK